MTRPPFRPPSEPATTPQPVIIMTAVLGALQFLAGTGQLTDLLPARAASWFTLLVAALTVGWGFYVHGQVTPLRRPRDRRGRRLVPAPPAVVPRGTFPEDLRADREPDDPDARVGGEPAGG